ncbi:MAG: hypothetical protein Q8L81_17765 [Bacteroidota bacterium]|nr:hypothetical protein [Bacteroidota bacterium]
MLSIKLKGGALYISLIICIVIGVTLSVFILIANFNQRTVAAQLLLTQLQFNLTTGLSIAQSSNFAYSNNNNIWQQINEDSIKIKKIQWGAFESITVETKNRRQHLEQSGLYGIQASKDSALIIKEKTRPLGITGKLKFNGYCYLSKFGFKPAYIAGESFSGDGQLSYFSRTAPYEIPRVKDDLINGLKNCIARFEPNTDSLISELPPILTNSFSSKTSILQCGSLNLSNYQLSGNIKIVGTNRIIIEKNNVLNNILVVANKVLIKKGFIGTIHIIASDSIILEEDCVLDYPSSLTVLNQNAKSPNMKGIFLSKNCKVNGSVIAVNDDKIIIPNASKVMVKLNKDCEIYGLLYSSNYAHIQGKIFGTIYCDTPMLLAATSAYENHLMDCELDSRTYASSLVIPQIFKTNTAYKCCKSL